MTAHTDFEKMAHEIFEFCNERELWDDAAIYFNGKALASWNEWNGEHGKEIAANLYEYEDKNPLDYCEYSNPETLTMTFEGMLYDVLNDFGYSFPSLYEDFGGIFEKYGYYFEMGHSWSLTACE